MKNQYEHLDGLKCALRKTVKVKQLIDFFNVDYPCDRWFELHVPQYTRKFNPAAKCYIQHDLSYDRIFAIKDVKVDGKTAYVQLDDENELGESDDTINKYFSTSSEIASVEDCVLFYIDNAGKKHEYAILDFCTYGHNNGIHLKEVLA